MSKFTISNGDFNGYTSKALLAQGNGYALEVHVDVMTNEVEYVIRDSDGIKIRHCANIVDAVDEFNRM